MWKKPGHMILIMITGLFIAVMVGILIGRQISNDEVRLFGNGAANSVHTQPSQTESTQAGKLNINFATAKELAMLPGIGDTYAKRIVEYREYNGPFLTIEDILNVKGIGQKRFESISKYITVGG